MPRKLIYRAPTAIADAEVIAAIKADDIAVVRQLPIQLGFHHDNWKFIQDICLRLSGHRDASVRSNALLGLSYAARFRQRLEKNAVKPFLLRALKDPNPAVVLAAREAIDDINRLLGWRIGRAQQQKKIETRYAKKKTPHDLA